MTINPLRLSYGRRGSIVVYSIVGDLGGWERGGLMLAWTGHVPREWRNMKKSSHFIATEQKGTRTYGVGWDGVFELRGFEGVWET